MNDFSYSLIIERGGIMCVSCTQTSDRRQKKNIHSISSSKAEKLVRLLRPVTFTFRETGEDSIGFIAQEVIEAAEKVKFKGNLVKTNKHTGMYAIPYANYIAILTAAMQVLIKRVDALEGVKA